LIKSNGQLQIVQGGQMANTNPVPSTTAIRQLNQTLNNIAPAPPTAQTVVRLPTTNAQFTTNQFNAIAQQQGQNVVVIPIQQQQQQQQQHVMHAQTPPPPQAAPIQQSPNNSIIYASQPMQQQSPNIQTVNPSQATTIDMLKRLKQFFQTLLKLAQNSLPQKYPIVRDLIQELMVSVNEI
jgi:hypothetical protein